MPVTPQASPRLARGLMICAAAVAGVMLLDGALHLLLAQTPFGAPKRAPEPQVGGIVGWILAKQSEFYREMSATIRAAKSDGSAVWTLLAISFAYGIFHAAGPGHGKAVISSYLVANQETARRGIVLSFASALMQSLVAVLIVGIGAWLLNATAKTMCGDRKGHRDRQLRADRGVRRPAGLDQGRRFHARAADAGAGACDRGAPRIIIMATTMAMLTIITIMITGTTTTIMIPATSMTSIAATPMVRRRANSPAPAAGSAASARSWRSASGRAPAPSWCWCSRWRRACSGPASPRPL